MTHEHDIFGPAGSLPPDLSFRSAPAETVVGRAGLRELWAVARLQRRAFRPPLAYGLTTLLILWFLPHVRFLVARQGNRIVGCAIGDRQGGQSRVINLSVDPDARRQGIGTRLLRDLEAHLPKGNIVLMVEEGNAAAQHLYRQEGYRPVGTGRDYYGRGQHGIWMQKTRPNGSPDRIRV
jgi:ribosomal-protein-alanine N-acetyltransferase